MITDVTIENFRGLRRLHVPNLAPVNIFVGGNGVGKTTIIEAIACAAQGGHPQFFDYQSRLRGLPPASLENDYGLTSYFPEFDLTLPLKVALNTTPRGSYEICVHAERTNEGTTLIENIEPPADSASPNVPFPPPISNVQQMKRFVVQYQHPSRSEKKRVTHNAALELRSGGQAVKSDICRDCLNAFFLRPGQFLLTNVNELLGTLWTHKKSDELVSLLRSIEPRLVTLIPNQKGRYPMPLADLGGKISIPTHLLGSGFNWSLVILAQILKQQGEQAPVSVIAVDEVDSGLHHTAMRGFWENIIKLLRAKKEIQFFCTTHSEELIEKSLEPFAHQPDMIAVFRVERERDGTVAVRKGSYELIRTSRDSAEQASHLT